MAKGGRFLQVGVAPTAELAIYPVRVFNQKITVLGSIAVLDSYGPALPGWPMVWRTCSRCSPRTCPKNSIRDLDAVPGLEPRPTD